MQHLPNDLDKSVPDHEIISTALAEDQKNGNRKTIVVSRDINMRVICDAIGLLSEDYRENEVIKKESELYTGFRSCLVDDQTVDFFYMTRKVVLDPEEYPGVSALINLLCWCLVLTKKRLHLCRFSELQKSTFRKLNFKDGLWGVKAKK